jgi:poly(A)-specific ribonuclease
MQLTRDNFQASLPALLHALKSCSFVSFDLEFSGLAQPRGPRQTPLDTTSRRFRSAFAATGQFFALQLGLSLFSQSAGVWSAHNVSIHLVPQEDEELRQFAIQPASIAFLAQNGFDFQKSFATGVGWLTVEREDKLLKELERGQIARDDILVTEERDKQFVESLRALLVSPASGSILLEGPDFQYPPELRDFAVMKPLNRFLRRLVFETVAREDPKVVVVGLGDRLALKRLGSEAEVAQFRAEELRKQKEAIQNRVGIRQLLDALTNMQIPMIGHNSLLDVLHLLHMSSSEVNDNLDQFKALGFESFLCFIVFSQETKKHSAKKIFWRNSRHQVLRTDSISS